MNDKLFGQQVPLYGEYLILKPDGTLDMTGSFDMISADPVTTVDSKCRVTRYFLDISQASFKQELIYNGKSSTTLKVMYRDFSQSLARPSFSRSELCS